MVYLSDNDINIIAESLVLIIKHSRTVLYSVSNYVLHHFLYIQQQTIDGVHDVAYAPYQDVN